MRALALMAAAALGQNPAPQPPPTFKAGVELVRLDIRVTDAEGRPLDDLRQDEVEVIEEGEGGRRPVVLFQHIEAPAESYADIARHTIAGEVSTNKGAARGHLYVLVFDQLHITPGNEQRARQAARRFVATRLRPGDRVALYTVPGPGPQIALTADAHRVSAALAEVHGTAQAIAVGAVATMSTQEAFEILRGNDLILQRVVDRSQAQGGSDSVRRADPSSVTTQTLSITDVVKEDARRIANASDGQARAVLAQLSDILRPLRAVEGRKTVVLISEGFNADHLAREIEGVAGAAAESYSVVSAFDVNRREIDITANEPLGADQANGIQDRIAPLGSLAAETGGALVIDAGPRADRAFAALADQSQDYYLVGFTPAGGRDRGAYRHVSVRIHRPGAQVSARTGFTLTDPAARLDRHQSIERALAAPYPLQGLPVRYTTYVLRGGAPGVQTVIVSLDTELPIAFSGTQQAADVVFVVRSVADGHVAASGHDTMTLPPESSPQRPPGVSTTGNFRVQFELPSGEYLMRAVVREPGGLVGSADRRFAVRALDGPSLECADLVLSSSRGDLPVRPTAYTGDGLSGVLELYARTEEQLREAQVIVELLPLDDDAAEPAPAISGHAELLTVQTTSRGVTREARLDLPLQSVLPGAYVARARILVGPDTVSQTVREVDIRGGRRPEASVANASNERGDELAFDSQAIVESATARDFVARLEQASSPALADARAGLERLRGADFAGSITAFETVLRQDSANAPAAFLLGWAFHGAGQDRQAVSAWRRAAFLDPRLVPAHLALADLYVHLSQPALAVQALRAGLIALPRSPELLDRLSRLEQR